MIRRIEIVNFMSHAHTVIEPSDGLTVLIGPNNCGKSAVVAALQILCHNDNSTYVTRHDQKECRVTVETADGHTVVWRRNKTSPKYEIDGQAFDRLPRGGVPDGLHAVLRMPKVSADGGQEFDVHFGEQKSPLFLIDKPGSHAAQFFASSSDAAKFVEMQKRHQAKMADARRDRAQEQAKAEKLAAALEALSPVDALEPRVLQLEQQHADLCRSAEAVRALAADLATLRQAEQDARQSARRAAALSTLAAPPILPDDAPLARHVQDARRTARQFADFADRAAALRTLTPPPGMDEEHLLAALVGELRDEIRMAEKAIAACRATRSLAAPPLLNAAAELGRALDAIVRQRAAAEAIDCRAKSLARLTLPPVLADYSELNRLLRSLVAAGAEKRSADAACRSLATLTPVPTATPTGELQLCVREMARAAETLKTCRSVADVAAADWQAGVVALRQWAERQPVCPTCGGPVDADRLLARRTATEAVRA